MTTTSTRRIRVSAVMLSAVLLGASACSSTTNSSPSTTAAAGGVTTTAAKKLGEGTPPSAGASTFEGTPDIMLADFKPEVNGFSFENYTNKTTPSNLTADEMKKFFGPQVCGSDAGGKCTLTPPAQQWMDSINDAMGGGHCEGMAVLALMFIKGKVDLKTFGDAANANGLKLEGNEKLAKEIAYWWAMQATTPTTSDRLVDLKPSEVAAKLKESFQPDAAEAYTFAFFKTTDGQSSGGHAVTPFGLKDRGNGIVDVAVYDNNFPNTTRALTIDTTNEKWTYNTAINPTEPPDLYEGDAKTKSLWLAPIGGRLKPQDCPFCGGSTGAPAKFSGAVGAFAGDNGTSYNELFLSEAAGSAGVDVTVTDLDGKAIPGAKEQPRFSGAAGIPPVQLIPAGVAFKVKLDGTALKEAISTDLTFIGPNLDQFIDGINLDPKQIDFIEFRPAENSITYETTSNESPTIGSGFASTGADFAVGIGGVDLPEGGKVELKMDQATGKVTVTNHGKAKGTYGVAIARIDETGEELFSHEGVDLEVGDSLVIDYGIWNKGEKLKAHIVSSGATTDVEFDNAK